MLKRGQISSETLAYVLTIVIVGVIFAMGSKYIGSSKKVMDKSDFLQLQTKLVSDIISTGKEYGRFRKITYAVPENLDEVCFVDLNKRNELLSSNFINFYPLIKDSIMHESGANKNIFFLGNSEFYSYYVENLQVNHPPYMYCFNGRSGKIDVGIEGFREGNPLILGDFVAKSIINPNDKTVIKSADGLVTIEVPQGTMSSAAEITIEMVDPYSVNSPNRASDVYKFGPSGATFSNPIILKLKYNPNNENIGKCPLKLSFRHFNDDGSLKDLIESKEIDCESSTAVFEISSFSLGAIEPTSSALAVDCNRNSECAPEEAAMDCRWRTGIGGGTCSPVSMCPDDCRIVEISGKVTRNGQGVAARVDDSQASKTIGSSGNDGIILFESSYATHLNTILFPRPVPSNKGCQLFNNRKTLACPVSISTPLSGIRIDAYYLIGIGRFSETKTAESSPTGGNARINLNLDKEILPPGTTCNEPEKIFCTDKCFKPCRSNTDCTTSGQICQNPGTCSAICISPSQPQPKNLYIRGRVTENGQGKLGITVIDKPSGKRIGLTDGNGDINFNAGENYDDFLTSTTGFQCTKIIASFGSQQNIRCTIPVDINVGSLKITARYSQPGTILADNIDRIASISSQHQFNDENYLLDLSFDLFQSATVEPCTVNDICPKPKNNPNEPTKFCINVENTGGFRWYTEADVSSTIGVIKCDQTRALSSSRKAEYGRNQCGFASQYACCVRVLANQYQWLFDYEITNPEFRSNCGLQPIIKGQPCNSNINCEANSGSNTLNCIVKSDVTGGIWSDLSQVSQICGANDCGKSVTYGIGCPGVITRVTKYCNANRQLQDTAPNCRTTTTPPPATRCAPGCNCDGICTGTEPGLDCTTIGSGCRSKCINDCICPGTQSNPGCYNKNQGIPPSTVYTCVLPGATDIRRRNSHSIVLGEYYFPKNSVSWILRGSKTQFEPGDVIVIKDSRAQLFPNPTSGQLLQNVGIPYYLMNEGGNAYVGRGTIRSEEAGLEYPQIVVSPWGDSFGDGGAWATSVMVREPIGASVGAEFCYIDNDQRGAGISGLLTTYLDVTTTSNLATVIPASSSQLKTLYIRGVATQGDRIYESTSNTLIGVAGYLGAISFNSGQSSASVIGGKLGLSCIIIDPNNVKCSLTADKDTNSLTLSIKIGNNGNPVSKIAQSATGSNKYVDEDYIIDLSTNPVQPNPIPTICNPNDCTSASSCTAKCTENGQEKQCRCINGACRWMTAADGNALCGTSSGPYCNQAQCGSATYYCLAGNAWQTLASGQTCNPATGTLSGGNGCPTIGSSCSNPPSCKRECNGQTYYCVMYDNANDYRWTFGVPSEICGNGKDDNCNGQIDDGCGCPGEGSICNPSQGCAQPCGGLTLYCVKETNSPVYRLRTTPPSGGCPATSGCNNNGYCDAGEQGGEIVIGTSSYLYSPRCSLDCKCVPNNQPTCNTNRCGDGICDTSGLDERTTCTQDCLSIQNPVCPIVGGHCLGSINAGDCQQTCGNPPVKYYCVNSKWATEQPSCGPSNNCQTASFCADTVKCFSALPNSLTGTLGRFGYPSEAPPEDCSTPSIDENCNNIFNGQDEGCAPPPPTCPEVGSICNPLSSPCSQTCSGRKYYCVNYRIATSLPNQCYDENEIMCQAGTEKKKCVKTGNCFEWQMIENCPYGCDGNINCKPDPNSCSQKSCSDLTSCSDTCTENGVTKYCRAHLGWVDEVGLNAQCKLTLESDYCKTAQCTANGQIITSYCTSSGTWQTALLGQTCQNGVVS